MKIDILSDLHLDFYFNAKKPLRIKSVKLIFDKIFTNNSTRAPADILIIAGDIGHYNTQNIEVLKLLQQEYYKYIICVLGNHDYYLVSNSKRKKFKVNSFNRVNEMKELINAQDNMYCLDGDIVEIDGIKFAGTMGWYDAKYLYKYHNPHQTLTKADINKLWKQNLNDSHYIYGIESFDDIFNIEYPKIESIYKECNVMITHVNPSCEHRHLSDKCKHDKNNAFYTFDGHNLIDNGSMKYWIFGHSHDVIEYDLYDVQCICNPLGYPSESQKGSLTSIKSIYI